MKIKSAPKTPQQIRSATEDLVNKHQAHFREWLDARKATIDSQKNEKLLSAGRNKEIVS